MPLPTEEIARVVRQHLSPAEQRQSIAYLDERPIKTGAAVNIGGRTQTAPWDAVLVFVDLVPSGNWGHPCLYVLVGADGERVNVLRSDMPPFLKGVPETWRLLWKGDDAPEWAVMVRR